MSFWITYILRCADGSLYIGVTNNLERRLTEHGEGSDKSSYTFRRRPVVLVYQAVFSEVTDAIAFEKQVKRWSRKKKEALINADQEALERLSKRRAGKPLKKCHPEELGSILSIK
jgi:putative endonuclease